MDLIPKTKAPLQYQLPLAFYLAMESFQCSKNPHNQGFLALLASGTLNFVEVPGSNVSTLEKK